jgi:hypothetical protein
LIISSNASLLGKCDLEEVYRPEANAWQRNRALRNLIPTGKTGMEEAYQAGEYRYSTGQ